MTRPGDPFPLLLVGFEGMSLPPSLARRLADGTVGGVVLFARNAADPAQVRELCREIRSAVGTGRPRPIVAVDQEGGRVRRFKDPGFTQFPPARCFEGLCCRAEAAAEAAGAASAEELRAVGIDVNFAPVLDVARPEADPVIGDRAFSGDPVRAARLGVAFASGTLSAGIVPVGKHFPGHGPAGADSHKELPVVRLPRRTLAACDLLPFRRAVRAGIPALMTAHVLYPALDRDAPATLSRRILQDLLRRTLRFRGVVFSDALEMKALSASMGIGEAAVRALAAGCDALLVCRPDETLHEEAAEAVARAVREPGAPRRAAAAATRRLLRLRAFLEDPGRPRASMRRVGCRPHRDLAALLGSGWGSSGPGSPAGRSGNIGEG